jgi:hypothetical protein
MSVHPAPRRRATATARHPAAAFRRRLLPALALLALLVAMAPLSAQQPPPPPDGGQRFLLVVSGLGGEDYYRELFHRWSLNLLDLAHRRYGIPDEHTVYLAADAVTGADGVSRKPDVLTAIAHLNEASAPGDRIIVTLIGHGTAVGPHAHFNLPGPDLTPQELAQALEPLEDRRLAVINTAPASAAFLPALSGEQRVVITATANPAETQHTRFAGFFIEALAGEDADADKDGAVSLLEAFRFAQRGVERAFERDNRLATEHALLDDDGDANGSPDPGDDAADGELAQAYTLAAPTLASAPSASAEAALALQVEARRLVDRIERLKRDRSVLGTQVYEQRLEALLVELALNRRAYRRETEP